VSDAITQRFAEMCERGEIVARPAWQLGDEPPITLADLT
jgi:hypothetical protein